MGYVFRAEHVIIAKDYALKMLSPDQTDEISWKRFQSEGKAIARLDHPNIVKIYNMGIDSCECPYYVMDLLDGVALSECISDKTPLSLDEIIDLFVQIASGLSYAHGRGIIHRDIKPSNIMLVDSGSTYPRVKIVDFGIAKSIYDNSSEMQSLTATGEIFGTPYYMSPEQCLGQKIDARSDIYSLGCTLFETLTGRPPFRGESALQTVMMHQNAVSPTLSSVSGDNWNDNIEDIVAKMLMKKPAERYQTMDQVVHDLERIKASKEVGKNVETGFKSSVESGLEKIGLRHSVNASDKDQNLPIIHAVTAMVIVVASIFIFRAYSEATRPPVKMNATLNTGVQTMSQINAAKTLPNKPLDNDIAVLKAVKAITSNIDPKTGMRVFHCPPVCIGFFAWRLPKEQAFSFVFVTGKRWRNAINDVSVPANTPIYFMTNPRYNEAVWQYPQILSKFAPGDLQGLRLESDRAFEAFGNSQQMALQPQQATHLFKEAAVWNKIEYSGLSDFKVANDTLAELDKHQTLREFDIHPVSVDVAFLGKRTFLKQLKYLVINELTDCDPVLLGLKDSPNIEMLDVKTTPVTAVGLRALAKSNLKALRIDDCPLDDAAITAISQIKTLNRLNLGRIPFKPAQIPVLAKLKSLSVVVIQIGDWSPADQHRLKSLIPGLK